MLAPNAIAVFLLVTLAVSGLVAYIAGWLVRGLAPRVGLVDRPGGHKTHAHTTPLGGGLAIWLSVVGPLGVGQIVLAVLLTWPELIGLLGLPEWIAAHLPGAWSKSGLLWLIVLASSGVMLLGLVDDLWPVDWRIRLAVQTAMAALVVSQGVQLTLFFDVPWFTATLTVVWIVGVLNAFNMLDNMDALSGGTAAIAAALLGTAVLLVPNQPAGTPQWFVAGFLFVLVGGLLGFLVHNRPPARLFLGDAGSYFVGFWLAVGTVLGTYSAADGSLPPFTVLLPLCVLAVPLYDLCTVVAIRLLQGRSPFHADRNHFSHRLVELGMSRPRAVATIHLITFATGLAGLVLLEVSSYWAAGLVMVGVASLLGVVYLLETAARGLGEAQGSVDRHG